jgi:hypothetical protein
VRTWGGSLTGRGALLLLCVHNTPLQAEGSCYELVEARVGGSLTRHDMGVQQDGPDTTTSMKHFVLAGAPRASVWTA